MTKTQSIDLPRALKDLFPDRIIKQLAPESGFVIRERKVKAVPFFWNLILGFGKAATRTIANLRRSFESAAGETLVPSAFYDRFNDGMVSMLSSAIGHVLDSFQLAGAESMEVATAFKDMIVGDASVIKLLDGLKTVFSGCRTNTAPAAAKIHAFLSVKGAGKSTVAITPERVHDKKKHLIRPWVRDRRLLFDLGYYRYQLFSCIARNGGFFISRLKENANPILTALIRKVRGNSIEVEKKRLQDILREVAEAFLYAGILTLLASRRLFRLLAAEDEDHRFRIGRWWSIFAANAYNILLAVLHPRHETILLNNFLKTLRHELLDPHLKRAPLLLEAFG